MINNDNGKTILELKDIDEDVRLIEHKIDVDKYMDLRMRIPKVLDAIEFNSILEKARRILKLSEVRVMNVPTGKYRARGTGGEVTEEDKKILEEYESTPFGNRGPLVEKYGFKNYQSLQSRIYLIRRRMKIPISRTAGKGKQKYSDEFISECVEKIKGGLSTPKIAETVDMTEKQLYKLITKRTGKTIREIKLERLGHGNSGHYKVWSDVKINTLIRLYKEGMKSKEIGEDIGLTRKQVQDKIYGLKNSGML